MMLSKGAHFPLAVSMILVLVQMYKTDLLTNLSSMNLDQPGIEEKKLYKNMILKTFTTIEIFTRLLDLRLLVFLSFDFPFVLGEPETFLLMFN